MNLKDFLLIALVGFVNCTLDDCLRKDSISCIQMQLYKTAKKYFDKPNVELISGLYLTKKQENGKSFDEVAVEERILTEKRVEDRQVALEDYFITGVKHLWNEGTISWNPLKTARSLIDSIPTDIKTEITNFVGEGRGKEKKQMKMLLPLLIGIKLKLAALGALAYMGIAIIAKKAVLAGIISLLVSGFIAIKNLIETHRKHEDLSSYQASLEAMNSWHASNNFYDHDMAASQNNQQQLAYVPNFNQKTTH